jgi:hypothetical protein
MKNLSGIPRFLFRPLYLRKQFLFSVVFLLSCLFAGAQTAYYYTGSGALNDVNNWGLNANGTGAHPADFSQANYQYVITNTAAATLTGSWTVSGTGSKVILGHPSTPAAPVTFTLAAGAVLTTPSSGFDVSIPATGNQKIVYQNSSILSLGAVNDVNLELTFDGATSISTSTTRTFGALRLINNASVDMGGVSCVVSSIFIEAGSVLAGPIGSSSQYIAVKSGGAVVINGTFRAGRQGGLFTTGVAIPVTATSSYGSILFQDATANITLGSNSTIDYYRAATSGQAGAQPVAALAYANLTLSNVAFASNKTFAAGVISVSGTFTINLLTGATITAPTQNILLLPGAKLVMSSATAFPTGGKLILQSDATGTASVSTMAAGASITGAVTVQQYIPAGARKYRFISHPFTTAQALSQLTDNIDITGNTTGSVNQAGQITGTSFTATATNNPSAFYFNTATADGNATNDGGWKAFTDATAATWAPGQGIRVLIRGTKAQTGTLDGSNAAPAAVTLDMSGTINTGNVPVSLVTGGIGATAGFNVLGNPYPAPVDMGAVLTATTGIANTLYVRNPQTSSYTTVNPIPASYVIPAYSAVVVKANAATTANFTEANKATCTSCPAVFRTIAGTLTIELKAQKDGLEYDNLIVRLGNGFTNNYKPGTDADKLHNDGFNMYTLTDAGQQLAADHRPATTKRIPLGISIPASASGTYTLTASLSGFSNKRIILHDTFTGTNTTVNNQLSYTLTVDAAQKATIGNHRLELIIADK